MMIDTFYLHLEFQGKTKWSINLPFLCSKCGICCTLEDFLTAGKINGNPEEHSEVHAKMKTISEELGGMWESDEAKYDYYIMHSPCPFLVNKSCSIYEIRPDGCQLFPKTVFGMQSQDCVPLTRFKKMRIALKKGRQCKEAYYFTGKASGLAKCDENPKPVKFTEKQYRTCVVKLRRAGMTDNELTFFKKFNMQNQSRVQE
jgi:Fe-S-cluster containining protein